MELSKELTSHIDQAKRWLAVGAAGVALAMGMTGEAEARVEVANQGHCGPQQGYGQTGNGGGAYILAQDGSATFHTPNGLEGSAVCFKQ